MSTVESTHVLVVGGSIAGMATALALARRGIEVRLVEADADTVPVPQAPDAGGSTLADPAALLGPPAESARRVPRRATPQAAHSHAFLARCRELLRAEAPDVLDGLAEAGAAELTLVDRLPAGVPAHAPHPDTSDLVVIAARRTTFEAVMRRAVLRRGEIGVEAGRRAVDLVVDQPESGAGVPRVRGVGFDDGSAILADLVVDATGRRTSMPAWLGAHGVTVEEEGDDCGITYLSRFYARTPGAPDLPLHRGFAAGGSFDRYSCLVFPGDAGSFSVTFGILPEDRPLRGLRDPAAFDAAVGEIPALAPWVEPDLATPLSEVRLMANLDNRIRRPAVAGRPSAVGWTAVGDAAATSNPAHSRGCTLAVLHATAVADAVADHAPRRGSGSPGDLAEACLAVVERDQRPWVEDSIDQDRHRLSRWRPEAEPWDPPRTPTRVGNGEAYGAAQRDAYVWRRFSRLQQLLDQPADVLGDRQVVARVRAVQARGWTAPPFEGPSHDGLVELIAATAAG